MEENSEYRNFIRLSVLLLDFGKDVLCRLLRFKFEAIDELRRLLDDNKRNLSKELSYSQRGILYPRDGITDTVYEKLDFSLTCVLIKTFLETSKSHDGKVLKYINVLTHQKDRLFCNPVCITVDEKKFKNMWDTLQQALIDIGTECFTEKSLEKKINEIYDMTITDFDKECHKTYKLQKVSDASTLPTKKSYIWTEGRARFVEISGWLDVAVIMMRSVLTKKISQKELAEKILQKPFVLKDLKPYQKKKLLKMAQDNEEKKQKENWYQDLDFTSLFFSLRHWGYIPKHTSGWGKPPNKIDFSLAADMERIRLVRRKVLNHKNGTDMEQVDYVEHKNELSSSIKRINDQLKDKHVEKTMKQLFKKWVISEYMQLKHSHQEPSEKGKMLVHSTSLPEDSKFYHETESLPISTNEDESYLYDINQSRNRIILESFIYKYSDEITNAFLGYYCGKPKEIFIVSYFKKPATKIKYWTEFEHLRVLNIDYKFVSSEATETIYSKECIENKINFQEMEKMAALITANSDSLMEKHTNLQMISGCSVRSKNRKILVETCIVFYCKTKEIIPLGEELFPQKLGEYNIDVREGMFSWTPGDVLLQHPNNPHNPLKMGCNIGLKVKEGERVSIGSLGGFVDFEDGLGFLTCAHVLYDEGQLIEGALPKESDYVVQPAGCNQEDECGKVVRYVFDPEGPIGVDAALVHVTKRCPDQGMFTGLSKDNMESAGFNFDEPLRYNSGRMRRLGEEDMDRRFIKSGAATYLTRGVLHFNGASVKVFDKKVRLNREGKEYAMKAQIEVRGLSGDVFAQPGDSGSFVFIVENDKSLVCIGMVEGWTTHYTAIVTPITDILQKLDLDSTQLHKFADQPSMEVG